MKKPVVTILMILLLGIGFGCKDGKRYHDEVAVGSGADANTVKEEVLSFQRAMNETFRDPKTSPLPDRYRKDFEGLNFFPPDSTYRVAAKVVRTPNAKPFQMPTTTDRHQMVVRFGVAYFLLRGQTHQLELYRSTDSPSDGELHPQLFLPFLDETNGKTTYAGGRYLDLEMPEGDSLIIDFNKAYNPYCAYNKKYSCPIVPGVNSLNMEIRAGVKAFETP